MDKRKYFGGMLFIPKDLKEGKERSEQNKIQKRVEEKHLKAYLRGDVMFHHISFGFDSMGIPIYHKVNIIWK